MSQKLSHVLLVLVTLSAFLGFTTDLPVQAQTADDACYAVIQTQPYQDYPDSLIAIPSGDGIDIGFASPFDLPDNGFEHPILLGNQISNPKIILSSTDESVTPIEFDVPLVGFDVPLAGFDAPLIFFDVVLIGKGTPTQAFDVPLAGFDVPLVGFDVPLVGFDDMNGNTVAAAILEDEVSFYVPLLNIGDPLDAFDEPILFLEGFDEPILFHVNNLESFAPDPDIELFDEPILFAENDDLITFDEPILFVDSGELITQVMAVFADITNNQNWALLPNGRWLPMTMLTVADGCNPPILDGPDLQTLGFGDEVGRCQSILGNSVATFSEPNEPLGVWGTDGNLLSTDHSYIPLQAHYLSRNGGYSYLLLGNDTWVRTQDVMVVGDCQNLPRLTDGDSTVACEVRVGPEQVAIRVGPSEDRGVFTTLSDSLIGVTGQFLAGEGAIWWQVDKADVPGGESANTLWVSNNDVETIGNCESVASVDAPPVIAPQATVEDTVETTPDNPDNNDGGDSPPPDQPVACYSLSLSVNINGAGSVSASPGPNCAGGKYTAGTVISVQATPNAGVSFTGWGGTCGGAGNPASVTMNSDCSMVAQFVIN